MQRSRLIFIALWLCSLLALPARARGHRVGEPHSAVRGTAAAKVWWNRLHEVDRALRAGEWASAKQTSDELLREMEARIESGPAAAPLLAMTCLFTALAEAGLQQTEAAFWDQAMAWSLQPSLRAADLSAYGSAGAALASRPPSSVFPVRRAANSSRWAVDETQRGTTLTNPERITAEAPHYTEGLLRACLSGKVVLATIIEASGKLRPDFQALEAANPLMQLLALDTLRNWRFKPGTLDGRPVAVFDTLTVSFKAKGLRPQRPAMISLASPIAREMRRPLSSIATRVFDQVLNLAGGTNTWPPITLLALSGGAQTSAGAFPRYGSASAGRDT
jgi:hypothetical protein